MLSAEGIYVFPLAVLPKVVLVAVLCGGGVHISVSPCVSDQERRLVGRWRIQYGVSTEATSLLQFDAREAGKGSFLSLDARRSSLTPAIPADAEWTQTANRVSFSGEIDVPIGNVGYESIELRFEGAFESETVISGEVTYIPKAGRSSSANHAKGTFKAERINEPKRPKQVKGQNAVQ